VLEQEALRSAVDLAAQRLLETLEALYGPHFQTKAAVLYQRGRYVGMEVSHSLKPTKAA
jgi:hypothetical protein